MKAKRESRTAPKTEKQAAIDLIERLPDHISLETIIAELLFKAKVLRGLEQLERGEAVSHEDVVEEMRAWPASAGQ
jgi:predicted transcriptional regulator